MRRDGFTLAETVVALALFAAAAAVFCQTALHGRMGLNIAGTRLDQQAYVDAIRHEVLQILDRAELEAGGEVRTQAHIRKGEFEDAGSGESAIVRWRAEVLPTVVLDVHAVTVTVEIQQEETAGEAIVIAYYVYRPDWYDAGERETFLQAKREAWERATEGRSSL